MEVLYRNHDYKGHYTAYCRKCKQFRSICKETFFEGTHVSFEDTFIAHWTWICHVSSRDASKLTGITREALEQYHRYFRDIASWKILSMPRFQLGGEGVVVQIDESVVTKRKYNTGSGVRKTSVEKWVLGIYDINLKLGVVVYVVKRHKTTLMPLIQEYVKPGSVIWTDGWAAYKGHDKCGYAHHTVNHSKDFKSADGTCTNGVEGYWSTLEQFCRHTEVLRRKLLAEHIDHFMYQQHFRGTPSVMFNSFLFHLKERYPV
ncbi:hypothetical protein ONE63_011312 [Megalurothrips usitatus]|uniref:ISXO2-like transposase domain-containing protein n=1 Tax=Megalurothrips usitatus TaxID=439358 RepID=A0AAV7WZM1_9NEOP|nr:hypothetical protein ONE63_011312 [Megalurothrips usitatus]